MSSRARAAALVAALVVPIIAVSSAPAIASPADDPIVAQGENWSVTTTPGGYELTYNLDEPLPIVNDAPTLIVDGVPMGLATESADGMSLSVTTVDPDIAAAETVEKGWSSGDDEKASEDAAPQEESVDTENDALMRQLDALEPLAAVEDPSDLGAYTVTEAEYDFGDRAVPLAAIGGIRGEMTGKMYLTSAEGARPTVVLLHGRHTSCSGSGSNPLRWPCGPTQMNIRSYLGYESTARALASHGYNVLSIAANAVNSNDNQLALDYGAQARGQLILDTLDMLRKASAGEAVSYDDTTWATESDPGVTTTRTLDDALALATTRTDQPAAASSVTAASLKGRFDLRQVGIMGHSRGGEGVVSAATLNQALESPFGIVSVLPLAPVDFGRMTMPDVPTAVFLPYCDGDVSNQQGQHFIDDSRHAYGDDVLRSAVWVMGANHNFFNTVWTPGLYPAATGDDWRTSDTTSTCSTRDDTRMTAAEQYQVGVSYMTGFFRLTMGGETQFQQMFDGSVKPSTTATEYADVRVMAAQPTSATTLITDFAENSALVRVNGSGTAAVCTNLTGRTLPQSQPYCATTKASSQVPHWTPGSFAPNVPTFPATQFLWNGGSSSDATVPSNAELRISIPAGKRDVSNRSQLTLKTAPTETVQSGTDFTITVVDGSNNTFNVLASEINPLAINRMPGGSNTTLNKIVLQQLTIPTASMTGINLSDVREVRITSGVGADGTGTGGVYLSDLAFDTPTVGTATVQTRTSINVAPTTVDEGNGPSTANIAVYLNRAETSTVTGYVSVLGSATGTVGIGMQKVTFAPGEVCTSVTVPTLGNDAPSASPSAWFKVSVTNTTDVVMGANAFTRLTVREDDGVTAPAVEALPVGAQGDVCAELAASVTPGELTSTEEYVAPGGTLDLTGSGFRAGEAVVFVRGEDTFEAVIADADGVATTSIEIAEDAELGASETTAVGAGSVRVLTSSVPVLAPTETALEIEDREYTEGDAITLTASIDGQATDGTVTFTDGPATSSGSTGGTARTAVAGGIIGTADVVGGVATLTLADGLPAGTYSVVANFARTGVASESTSAAVTIVVAAAPVDSGEGDGSDGGDGSGEGTGGSVTDGSPTGTATGALAVTGSDGFGWSLMLTALLMITGGTLLYARQRRAAELAVEHTES